MSTNPAGGAHGPRHAPSAAPVTTPTAPSPPAILFDTNVILDVILAREPWAGEATRDG